MNTTTKTAALLEFVLPGTITTFDDSAHHTQTGCGRTDDWEPTGSIDYPDDCPVLDKVAVLEADPMLCIRSPMLNVMLETGKVSRYPVPGETMAAGIQGAFKALATARKDCPEFSGLDYVSVSDFVVWWTDKGARLGRMVSGAIVWN